MLKIAGLEVRILLRGHVTNSWRWWRIASVIILDDKLIIDDVTLLYQLLLSECNHWPCWIILKYLLSDNYVRKQALNHHERLHCHIDNLA